MEPEPAPPTPLENERLPSQLAAQLTAETRDALGHPLRREILRALNESAEPRTPGEIAAATLPQASPSVVSYHALVLASRGTVEVTGAQQGQGAPARLYASKVAGDERIAAVLQATRGRDRWAADPQ